ncbi:50S ribosomal protein L11 methyltransferase [Roseivivax sediminis]|uniref:Ribosomal protein L11 methyltransferase n=1 Tax=Roseivivax sediminis TaxID=936889 RepID=A0A1I1US04_9RHOB|nr:50S ribosomal protein L11 methyltransferase [Roseivivax sediminis]SFD73556.1 [LSU ribosomal protein L11P]-lysine N-methyltransferase [Roseivivax sediminis]
MATYTALTTLKGREPAEALGEALEDLDPAPTGVGVFEVEDDSGLWEVGGYFDELPDDVGLALLAAAYGAAGFAVSEVPDTDWVDKVRRELTPVEAGRFFVYGSHDADKIPEGAEPLLIEAAMAFGTGHHGTTLGCLRALDRLIDAGVTARNVADIGCGTAVLAMAAARVWPNPVLASDIDAVAVEVAEANVRANALEGRVRCIEATGFDHPDLAEAAPFDLIFANILMAPLIELAPAVGRSVKSGGHAILSGILTRQAEETLAAYDAAGFAEVERDVIGDWVTLTLQRAG